MWGETRVEQVSGSGAPGRVARGGLAAKVAFEEGLDGEGGWADTRMESVLAEWGEGHEEV